MNDFLLSKYDVAGPRYTSYPTVPYWDRNSFFVDGWENSVKEAFAGGETQDGISLYIHLPFCESLCTFCACHKHITKRHEVELAYIQALLKEWGLYVAILGKTPTIKEIHLGGGTPTFFSPYHLKMLLEGIFNPSEKAKDFLFGFEGHPNNTTREHLQTMYSLGSRRVSFGIQDYSLKVQRAIHRIQPFENVSRATSVAREIGYTSISHDLVFGLPFQTPEDVKNTMEKTISLIPDRIALYSYAHVPWIKGNGQRGFDENNLPTGKEKRLLYETGRKMLKNAGYLEIGMDHFSLASDELYVALEEDRLHRNFMGYTTSASNLLIGLGVSAISDSGRGFAQNVKSLDEYYSTVERGTLPIERGHHLDNEDLVIRKHIQNLMCHFYTSWQNADMQFIAMPEVLIQLEEMENDGLLSIESDCIRVTSTGRPFVRNICMAFDRRLQRKKPETRIFSATV